MRRSACIPFGVNLLRTMLSAAAALAVALPAAGQKPVRDSAAETTVPRAPEEDGPRRWKVAAGDELELFDAPSADAAVVKVVADGAVLANLGCERGEAGIWCSVRPIRGGARGFAAAEFLLPAPGPDGRVPTGRNDSSHRARKRDFDQRGRIRCAQERGEDLGECTVEIARAGGGDATVVATFSNGFARTLYFVNGEFVSANATMSGVGTDTEWRREDDVHVIRVDDQVYELPDALVFGEPSRRPVVPPQE